MGTGAGACSALIFPVLSHCCQTVEFPALKRSPENLQNTIYSRHVWYRSIGYHGTIPCSRLTLESPSLERFIRDFNNFLANYHNYGFFRHMCEADNSYDAGESLHSFLFSLALSFFVRIMVMASPREPRFDRGDGPTIQPRFSCLKMSCCNTLLSSVSTVNHQGPMPQLPITRISSYKNV